jgi:urease accessory protein
MSDSLRIFTQHLPGRRHIEVAAPANGTLRLVLPFELRQKARQRARLTAGIDVGIQLPRGTVLRGGDQLRAADGTTLEIVAARERVSTVWCRDLRRLAQVAYHLGNRHVALEIGTGWVRYLADHVLDAMVTQLGLAVVHHDEPFEPESGAYAGHGHSHAHTHVHAAGHEHSHAHAHSHDREHSHDRSLAFGMGHEHVAVGSSRHPALGRER